MGVFKVDINQQDLSLPLIITTINHPQSPLAPFAPMAQKQLNLSPEAITALIEALSVLNVTCAYLVVIAPIYPDYSPQLLVMRPPLHLCLLHCPTMLMVLQSQQPMLLLCLQHSKPL